MNSLRILLVLVSLVLLLACQDQLTEQDVMRIREQGITGPPGPAGPPGPPGLTEEDVRRIIQESQPTYAEAPASVPAPAHPTTPVLTTVSPVNNQVPVSSPTATARPPLVLPATAAELAIWAEDSIVRVQAGDSGGSGFIFEVEGDTAFVVTNHHVIEDSDTYDVVVGNSKTYEASLLGSDSARDVAVLSICCAPDFFAIDWGSGFTAELGDEVVTIGYPRGSAGRVTVTTGSILDNVLGDTLGLVSHSAPLNPGSSGGPLLSMQGEVLGVNSASSNLEEGVFYAVPYSVIQKDVLAWKGQLVVLPTATPVPRTVLALDAPRVEGKGDSVVECQIASGRLVFSLSHKGDRNFAIWLSDNRGGKELLVNEIGQYVGSTLIIVGNDRADLVPGNCLLEITADGNWIVEMSQQ